ncbi:MAG: glycosyltransferase family 1 protein [Candidatus Micrarchaeota archaeon]|nr:glycosyltransferase family 1 protein [Candidatus Micrarchaeota archaeon]MDE1834224.1 glycosyltransferase family 1 protein [Candidatus Micrarchaeota archaeon]MDE1859600.1 glycosyltransferase family 1 protein [Candidatus Micrarchaeota archaeon]
MKVLLHGPHKADYIYTGFSKLLGERSVVSYLHPSFLIPHPELRGKYDIDSTDGILEDLDRFDLIAFSQRAFLDPNFNQILNANTSATKIFVDGEDDFFLRNVYKHKEIKFYFKRELYRGISQSMALEWGVRYFYGAYLFMTLHNKLSFSRSLQWLSLPYAVAVKNKSLPKLLPFPLAIEPTEVRGPSKRDLNLFFCMSVHKRLAERHRYYDYLNKAAYENDRINIEIRNGGLKRSEYLKRLMSSKASISLRGMGFDCDRYWEIPCYGAMLMSQRLPLLIPHDFVDGESAVFFDTPEELMQKLEKYVVGSDEWKSIAREGQRLFFKYHTPEKRVKDLILKYL